jgi:hypothetical protein
MGEPLGNLYHDLENEVALLLRKWDEFDELFNDDQAQLALLNQVASNFFSFLQVRWHEDAMLHISRLTDPPETGRGRQANLTVRRLSLAVTDQNLKATMHRNAPARGAVGEGSVVVSAGSVAGVVARREV